jgi:hypothetical protein
MWDAHERQSILATGATPVSLWPLVTVGNVGVDVMLKYFLGLGVFFACHYLLHQ